MRSPGNISRRALCLFAALSVIVVFAPAADASGARMTYARKKVAVPAGSPGTIATATCPSGTLIAGGGVSLSSGDLRVWRSVTDGSNQAWSGESTNPTATAGSMTVYADCAKTARIPGGAGAFETST